MCKFPATKAGLQTVGYQLKDTSGINSGSRVTAGIADLGNGYYSASKTFTDPFVGTIIWDTGEITPLYAAEDVNIVHPAPSLATIEASTVIAKESTVGALPTLSEIEASTVLAKETTVDALPTLSEIEASTVLAKEATVSGLPGAAAIADAVWNETAADHSTVGSTGKALQAAGTAGDPWSTELPGEYAEGSAGAVVSKLIIPDYTGPVVVIPAPDHPNLQTLYGYVVDPDGTPVKDVIVNAYVEAGSHANNEFLQHTTHTATTDVGGLFQLVVVQGATYTVDIPLHGKIYKGLTITTDATATLESYV